MIRCSLGTAKVLGLKEVKADTLPTTAYLMVGERCRFNCAFCAQARESEARADMLARVTWPGFAGDEVMKGLAVPEAKKILERICFQVVQDNQALAETKEYVKQIKAYSEAPICVSAGPRTMAEIEELISLGVDHVSIALDAATPEIYRIRKDGSWQERYNLLKAAAERFPGQMATHLIVGLGESEEEMNRLIQDLYDQGITVALFAFTPIRGTVMGNLAPPEMVHYRKIQVGHYLMKHRHARAENFAYRKGKLINFGIPEPLLQELIGDGEAFRTSGCTGCNRPYYNEIPGHELYNYPRPLHTAEINQAWKKLRLALNFHDEGREETASR